MLFAKEQRDDQRNCLDKLNRSLRFHKAVNQSVITVMLVTMFWLDDGERYMMLMIFLMYQIGHQYPKVVTNIELFNKDCKQIE